jgi:hypothetical protein
MKDETKRNVYSRIILKVVHLAVLNESNRSNRCPSELFVLDNYFYCLIKVQKLTILLLTFVTLLFILILSSLYPMIVMHFINILLQCEELSSIILV